MMLLRANVLLRPTSGVRPALVDALVAMLNAGIVPAGAGAGQRRRQRGPRAAQPLALALMGEGEVLDAAGRRSPAAAALARGRTRAVSVRAEGRPRVHQRHPGADRAARAPGARRPGPLAHRRGRGRDEPRGAAGDPTPLDPRIHAARPHRGPARAAALMRALLDESEIRESHRENDPRVQDAYSLRCAPQVLGAVADAIHFAARASAVELNASTDNPLVFDNGDVLSGGNFHGQPVAQALDLLADHADHAAGHRRAAGRAAGQSRPVAGPAGVPDRRSRALAPAS